MTFAPCLNKNRIFFIAVFVCVWPSLSTAQSTADPAERLRFRIDAPESVLADVPLSSSQRIRISALTKEGKIHEEFEGPVEITGIRVTENGEDVSPTDWKNGVLELQTDLSARREVFLIGPEIKVQSEGESVSHSLRLIWKWWSLLPPVAAIVLAICLKDVIVALLAGVFMGALVLTGGNPFEAFLRTIDTHILHQLVPPSGSTDHMRAILFTLMLGSMIGMMSASGGTRALVDRLTRYAKSREHGQIMTWFLGLVVFFDDYANTLLVGSTMRSVSDRLRISREKLAFLVDSTAAPVAGLAIISTWVGFELSQISPSLDQLHLDADAYRVFLATIPYRFYPLLLLFFVAAIAWTGRDFGPMLQSEIRVAVNPPDLDEEVVPAPQSESNLSHRFAIWNAILPLGVLLFVLSVGIAWELQFHPDSPDSYRVLLYSAFSAALVAGLVPISLKSLTLANTVAAAVKGLQSMMLAVVILVLAWSIASLCDGDRLNTAGFIIDSLGDGLSARWMPATAFVIGAAVSFATGSSFATMGLLMPLFITLTYYLMMGEGIAATEFTSHPYTLGTIGAVLAGAIWGDHCSPISDTTVLSSAAAGCDHLSHVNTQLPYAMVVGLVSLGVGYVPVAWGVSPYLSIPVALAVLSAILGIWGQKPTERSAGSRPEQL